MNDHRPTLRFSQSIGWLAAVLIGVSSLAAAENARGGEEGIIVQGAGSAKARPTEVEISGSISAEAELAADATVKFRDAKKRALAAFAALKNPDLTVVPEGVSVNTALDANTQMMMMRGMTTTPGNPKVRLAEQSRIVLANADKVSAEALVDKVLKILDVARDAGFQVGPPQASNYYEMQMRMQQSGDTSAMVSFKLPDRTALRDQAYRIAFDDAKSKAQKLAALSGVKLGRVVSLHEADAPNAGEEKSLAGPTAGDLILHVNLAVQFEILK